MRDIPLSITSPAILLSLHKGFYFETISVIKDGIQFGRRVMHVAETLRVALGKSKQCSVFKCNPYDSIQIIPEHKFARFVFSTVNVILTTQYYSVDSGRDI